MDKDLGRLLYNYLLEAGMAEGLAAYINLFVLMIVVLVLVFLLDLLIWKVLRALSVRLARKSINNFDNFLVAHRVPRYVAHIVPLTILLEFVPVAFSDFDYAEIIALKTIKILFVLLVLVIFRKFFKSVNGYLRTRPKFRDKPINSCLGSGAPHYFCDSDRNHGLEVFYGFGCRIRHNFIDL